MTYLLQKCQHNGLGRSIVQPGDLGLEYRIEQLYPLLDRCISLFASYGNDLVKERYAYLSVDNIEAALGLCKRILQRRLLSTYYIIQYAKCYC